MSLRWAAAALLALASLTPTIAAPGAEPGPEGYFDGAELEVVADRFVAPGLDANGSLTSEEREAAWRAYLDARQAACVASSTPGLDRCDVIVVDGRTVPPLTGSPSITLSDLAQFRPIVGELVVEPDGWGVVGTPTNFYATAETHTMEGELFDAAIEVRWTPSSYAFDYGDGTVETSDASGTAWRGTEESWTETATSHVYAERSDVTASLNVVFTAEVDAGSGWFAVPGTLPVEAPSVGVKVFEVDTVLTNGDCMANPAAEGCG